MNKIFNFLRKYWLCFLLSVLMVVGMALSTIYKDVYEIGDGMIRFDLQALYLIYGIPLFSLIYGCLTYLKTKKTWLPQLVLYAITCIYFSLTNLIIDKELDAWENILLFSVYPIVFSLIGTGLTAFIYYVIKSTKEESK